MKSGIYKITNKINGNSYIGLSCHIEKRWKDHIKRAFDESQKEYDKVLYKAFRKYGVENFDFEILEECAPEQLNAKEQEYIAKYDTFHHGYNQTPGGDASINVGGERHPNHKVTEADVRYIRELWASKTISTREMYYEFANRIGKSGFKKIYTWQTWKNILPELNTQENRDWHRNNGVSYANPKELNPKAHLSKEEFEDIDTRYKNGEPFLSIYQDYKDKYKDYKSFLSTHSKRLK